KPALRCRAKAALVVGVGSDALLGPDLTWALEAVAVIVEAVQAEDHRLHRVPGPALRQPFAQRQHLAIGGDEAGLGEARHRLRLGCGARRADSGQLDILIGRRRAADQQHQGDEHQYNPNPAAHGVSSPPQARCSVLAEGMIDCRAAKRIIVFVRRSAARSRPGEFPGRIWGLSKPSTSTRRSLFATAAKGRWVTPGSIS